MSNFSLFLSNKEGQAFQKEHFQIIPKRQFGHRRKRERRGRGEGRKGGEASKGPKAHSQRMTMEAQHTNPLVVSSCPAMVEPTVHTIHDDFCWEPDIPLPTSSPFPRHPHMRWGTVAFPSPPSLKKEHEKWKDKPSLRQVGLPAQTHFGEASTHSKRRRHITT